MSPRLPPQAQLARWAVRYGPLVLPYAKRLYDQGRFRQLSLMHARTLADGTFSWEMVDGDRLWVVWSGDEVVATYPDRPDLRDRDGHPFPGARRDRRQDPDEVPAQRMRRRLWSLTPSTGSEDGADGSAGTGDDAGSHDAGVPGDAEAHDDAWPAPPPESAPPTRDHPEDPTDRDD